MPLPMPDHLLVWGQLDLLLATCFVSTAFLTAARTAHSASGFRSTRSTGGTAATGVTRSDTNGAFA